jgi:hypothetical protein
MRRAARVDCNQADLVEAMRRLGFAVEHTHMIGGGTPDVVVGFGDSMRWVEFKVGNAPLTPFEEDWHEEWNARGPAVVIIRDIADVVALRLRLMR